MYPGEERGLAEEATRLSIQARKHYAYERQRENRKYGSYYNTKRRPGATPVERRHSNRG